MMLDAVFGIIEVSRLHGLPHGATYRLRMRHDDFAYVVVRTNQQISRHVLVVDDDGEVHLGPTEAINTCPPKADSAEIIEWFKPGEKLPDSDITVLIHTDDDDASEPVWLGYWAAFYGDWMTIDGVVLNSVLEWAHIPRGSA
jgi:hypothetical protein